MNQVYVLTDGSFEMYEVRLMTSEESQAENKKSNLYSDGSFSWVLFKTNETEKLCSMLANCEAVREQQAETIASREAEIERLSKALKLISKRTADWNANKLGNIQLQRQRWIECGKIALAAVEVQ